MEIVKMEFILDGHHGIYIPQIFAEQYPEWVKYDEDMEVLKAGPDHPEYWEAWDSVLGSEYEGQFLITGEGGNDLFICSPSILDPLIRSFSDGEGLEDCPNELRGTVQKLAYDFLTDRDEFISEDEALQHFSPSQYNDALINKALEWMSKELAEARNG